MKRKLIIQGSGNSVDEHIGELEQGRYFRLAMYAIVAALGVLIPRATVYGGLSPFGISLAACVDGPACVLVCLGAGVGYLLSDAVIMPMRYIAAMICVIGIQWALGLSEKITSGILYSPLLAMLSTLVTGVAINSMTGFQWDVFASELCESILAGGAALFFKSAFSVVRNTAGPRILSLQQQVSLTITVAVVLTALTDITFEEISVGRILIMVVILFAAYAGQQHGGSLAGVVFGAATALCTPSYVYLTAGYAFGGMLSGLFSRFGKGVTVMVFLLVNILVSFSAGDVSKVLVSSYEAVAASVIFVILPRRVEKIANILFSRAQTLPAAEGVCRSVDMRLTQSADTMRSIAKTVDAVSEKLTAMNAPEIKEVYGIVCEHVCNGCKRRDNCWKREFTDTMAEFRKMGDMLRQNGFVDHKNLSSSFQKDCRHLDQVVSTINNGYSHFVIKEKAYHRLSDIRSVVTDQFDGLASLLDEISQELIVTKRVDMETANRVEQLCERYRIECIQVLCLIGKGERMTVELLTNGSTVIPDESSRFHKELSTACGCELAKAVITTGDTVTKIRWTQKPRYIVRFAGAQLNCHREKLCGDAYESFYDHEGRCCVVLSDGMGSGGRAAVDGAMTAALASKMMQAGFCFENIVQIINSALIVKSGDESLSTLDIMQIDLMSGKLRGMKAGAAPSFIYSGGKLTTVKANSLPIGILRDVDVCCFEEYVKKGDMIVMLSDGALGDDTEAVEELISRLCAEHTEERKLANEIVFYAREKQGKDHTDDTTALVMKVC